MQPSLDDVQAAAERIRGYVHRTPVLTSRLLDEELGAQVFFKAENMQKVGAFKARGACNFVALLGDEAKDGVITHSSGNHGAALAWAAGVRGTPCIVVMPETAPAIKRQAVEGYGARVILCKEGQREITCADEQARTGAVLVPPFDHEWIIAGQGTAALELLDEVGDLDVMVAPVGGGGLLAGTAVVAKANDEQTRVVGAEPEAVDDAFRSLRDGVRHPTVAGAQTWGDGLKTGLGERNFAILQDLGVEVVLVSEAAMVEACHFHLLRMKTLVEPSGATGLAALRAMGDAVHGKRIGVILTGGNTDLAWYNR